MAGHSFYLNALSLFTGRVNVFIMKRYAANELLKKEVQGKAAKSAQKLLVEINFTLFSSPLTSHDLSACLSVEHTY